MESNSTLIIDVRNQTELILFGKIPNSVNIPFPEILSGAFQLNHTDFKSKYGVDMPPKGFTIVIYCTSGVRASKAARYLKDFGYSNLNVYLGSFNDWLANGGTVVKGNVISNQGKSYRIFLQIRKGILILCKILKCVILLGLTNNEMSL